MSKQHQRRNMRKCQCGCNMMAPRSQLVAVEAEEAKDETLRETVVKKRYFVRPACREAFTEELQIYVLLQLLVRAHAPEPKPRWWKRVSFAYQAHSLFLWIRRLKASRKVLQLQHAMEVRNKGFDVARQKATRSAILFGAPRFLQGPLARYFMKQAKAENAPTNIVKLPHGTHPE